MNTERPKRNLEEIITAACHGLTDSFERLHGLMVEPHLEDMSAEDIARNLAEFGRSQMSGEAKASEADDEVIGKLAAEVDLEGELAPRFYAYVSGCVLGWVAAGQLDRDRLGDAFAIVRERSVELFTQQEDPRD